MAAKAKAPSFTSKLKRPALYVAGFFAFIIGASLLGDDAVDPDAPPTAEELRHLLPLESEQAIFITTSRWSERVAVAQRFERDNGTWKAEGDAISVTIGEAGFSVQAQDPLHQTAAGLMRITGAITSRSDAKHDDFPIRTVKPGECWITDRTSSAYNRAVSNDPANPASGATDWCTAAGVDLFGYTSGFGDVVMTDFNVDAQNREYGPAVFLRRQGLSPSAPTARSTDAAFVFEEVALQEVLRWLDLSKSPVILAGPRSWLRGATENPMFDTGWTTLRRGSQGEAVIRLQTALGAAGHPVTVDGIFGAKTEAAVRAYQQQTQLTVDGLVGPRTASALGLLE